MAIPRETLKSPLDSSFRAPCTLPVYSAFASSEVHSPDGRHRESPARVSGSSPYSHAACRDEASPPSGFEFNSVNLLNSFTAILPSLCRECRSFSPVSRPRSDEQTGREFSVAYRIGGKFRAKSFDAEEGEGLCGSSR